MGMGRLIAVVGPSGVGKDSVMEALCAACPGLLPVRRVITRAPGAGGEDCEAVSVEAFEARRAAGAFCLHWEAHGLRYGIPQDTLAQVQAGQDRLANLSRAVLPEAQAVFPRLTVLHLTARPETLAARLSGRNRETPEEIARRLARAPFALPEGVPVVTVSNDGPLPETVARALQALQSVRG